MVTKVDGSWLGEAFSNLIDNAIFYTLKGKVKVSVATRLEEQVAQITISDTGVGISTEDQRRIFTKFTRGKKAALIKPDGSGLGMYIARKIIEAHGGKIQLSSQPGKGTTVCVTLPMEIKHPKI